MKILLRFAFTGIREFDDTKFRTRIHERHRSGSYYEIDDGGNKVLKIVGDGNNLCVDANGRFDLKTAIEYGKALEPYNLKWYEEAGDPLDYELNSKLSESYKNGLATGENLFSMQDARNLIRYGGMRKDIDWLQFDCSLSYGLVEYLKTLKNQLSLKEIFGNVLFKFLVA